MEDEEGDFCRDDGGVPPPAGGRTVPLRARLALYIQEFTTLFSARQHHSRQSTTSSLASSITSATIRSTTSAIPNSPPRCKQLQDATLNLSRQNSF